MEVSLSPELERLVSEKVACGMYRSTGDVIREALLLLRVWDDFRQTRLETLRKDIAIGIGQAEAGWVKPLEAADVKRRLRERMEGRRAARR